MAAFPALSKAQQRHFAAFGYVVLPKLLNPAEIDRAVDFCWSKFPALFRRDEPRTWRGKVTDSCMTSSLPGRQGLVKFQKADIRPHIDVRQLLPLPVLQAVARQLIHADVRLERPIQRGLYPLFPISRLVSAPPRGHLETHPMQIGTLSYLNDVKEGEGALMVWPGSHRLLYSAFDSKVGYVANTRHKDIIERLNLLQPVQVPAGKGDTIFFHYRLFHSPSNNNGRSVRFAYLCDIMSSEHAARAEEKPGALWEDWPIMAALDDGACAPERVYAALCSSWARRLWMTNALPREIFYALLMDGDSKIRAKLSRQARAQGSVADWATVRKAHATASKRRREALTSTRIHE